MIDKINIQYKDINGPFWYVRLGALLEYIQENIMYIIKVDDTTKSPMLKFDTEVESNLMFVEDLQVSIDPNICLVNRTLTIGEPAFTYTFIPSEAEPFESSLFTGYNCYGQIMNIYVHMKWILLKLDELKDANTNKVTLVAFLNNMLSSINVALGGTNSLEATIDEVTNTVIIRDANPLPNKEYVINKLNDFYKTNNINKTISNGNIVFDLYRYNTNSANTSGHASFIKDFNFTTEISPELAVMLTVGATANSTVVGENSTAFSRFNTGLTDRFKKEITVKSEEDKKLDIDQLKDLNEEKKLLYQQWSETYLDYTRYLIDLSTTLNGVTKEPTFTAEKAETYKNAVTNFTTYLQQARQKLREEINKKKTIDGKTDFIVPEFLPGTGFIPFNMSVTMDGLSGMKIYNKFDIDTQFLPSNYPESAEFLIKNIVHKIENSKWFTTLESVITIKGDFKTRTSNLLYNKSGEVIPQKLKDINAPSTNGLWANQLRDYLKSLGYTEKPNQLDNNGDITKELYYASTAVFKGIKLALPSIKIQITAGNDTYHFNKGGSSKHISGRGIDFGYSPINPTNKNTIIKILTQLKEKGIISGFLNEYDAPSKNATAGHFHFNV